MEGSRAAFLDPEELDPDDDEETLDPWGEYDAYLTQDDCGEEDE